MAGGSGDAHTASSGESPGEIERYRATEVDAAQFADETLRQQWRDEKGMIVFQLFDPHRESTRIDIFVSEPFVFAQEFKTVNWHTSLSI